jgi:hypothetical protein
MLDCPISTSFDGKPEFVTLPHERLRPENGSEEEEGNENSNSNENDGSDLGSLYGEAVIPRPLGGYVLSDNKYELKLPKLKHLYLGQPSEPDRETIIEDYTWSTRAENACYSAWRKILQASMPTLSTLVLEQRPGADSIERDGLCEEIWMETRPTPRASKYLLKMVQMAIEEGKAEESL